MSLRLRLRPGAGSSDLPLDGAAVIPDRLAGLPPSDAARLPACDTAAGAPRRGAPALGDLFTIDDDGDPAPDSVTVEGDLRRTARLGAGMSRGRLFLRGDAGPRTGEGMTGGLLLVDGSAGDRLGTPVAGGTRGVDGGVIVVRGAVGAMAAFRMRRGTIFIGGSSGPGIGAALIAGTLVLARAPGPDAGALMHRGTMVVLEPYVPGAMFAAAGRASAPWLKTWWDAIGATGVPLPPGLTGARYRRYSGDMACGGLGEILILEGDR